MRIVEVSLVIIGEYLVGFADGFEFDVGRCSLILTNFVGVT